MEGIPEFQFEKLEVWKESRELNKIIYELTREFPKSEQFGLTSQIRRAVVSVVSNLIEGNSRKSAKDKAHFTTVSYASLMEMMAQILLAQDLKFIKKDQVAEIRIKTDKVAKLLSGLRRSQLSNP